MNKPLPKSVHKEQQAAIATEMQAREAVAYNVIVKAGAFMRTHGQHELAAKWLADEIEPVPDPGENGA